MTRYITLILAVFLSTSVTVRGQMAAAERGAAADSDTASTASSWHFDFTRPLPAYSDEAGFGYDIVAPPQEEARAMRLARRQKAQRDGLSHIAPFFFSVKVPDGNYRVTVTLGSRRRNTETVVRAEQRRLMVDAVRIGKGQSETFSFIVNKRSPLIADGVAVALKPRERGSLDWDDRLTLEFNGYSPGVRSVSIQRVSGIPTVYLCGNSTVVDQPFEPWTSWGQIIPCWFDDGVVFANHAESGLTAGSFLAQRRLDKILSTLRQGDYVLCEFGHNDQKEHRPGDGAWYNFAHNLKIFIDKVRAAGAEIIFLTPTQRRSFDTRHEHILETHGDYPDAMRSVAEREHVPVIELHDMTRVFFETLGYEGSTHALVHYPANTFPNQPKPLADNTHFNPYGAYEVAKMVVMGMKKLHLPVVSHLRAGWTDFSPARPDAFSSFVWYPSPLEDTRKPDGN